MCTAGTWLVSAPDLCVATESGLFAWGFPPWQEEAHAPPEDDCTGTPCCSEVYNQAVHYWWGHLHLPPVPDGAWLPEGTDHRGLCLWGRYLHGYSTFPCWLLPHLVLAWPSWVPVVTGAFTRCSGGSLCLPALFVSHKHLMVSCCIPGGSWAELPKESLGMLHAAHEFLCTVGEGTGG